MKLSDNIKKLIRDVHVLDVNTSDEMDQRIIHDAINAQKRTSSANRQPNVWRTIMKTKTAKLAIAAVVLVALLSLTLLDKTVSPVYALEQSLEAMKNVTWMHAVPDSIMAGGETVFGETWLSVTEGIGAIKREDGSAEIVDYVNNESYSYDPAAGTITLTLISDADVSDRTNSYSEYFDNIIDNISMRNDVEITTTTEVQNGEKVKVVEVVVPIGKTQNDMIAEKWRFVMDEKSYLPIRMQLQGCKADGKIVGIFDSVFDYPSSGPMDIYQLGAPKNAKIIDKRVEIDVQTILDNYKIARENKPSQYTAIVIFTNFYDDSVGIVEEATIYYVDGNKYRSEKLSISSNIMDSQSKGRLNLASEMGDSLESMLNWWTKREHLSRRIATMYDGAYEYRVRSDASPLSGEFQDNAKVKKYRMKNSRPPNIFEMYSGAGYLLNLRHGDNSVITLAENDYSKQNNLICLHRLDEGRAGSPLGRRYKSLCYIDQDKDYVCRRIEDYIILGKVRELRRNDPESFLIKKPDLSLEKTQVTVKEVTELGQSEQGRWYPKKVEHRTTTQRENGRVQENGAIFTIYLDTVSEFPEGVFDPEAFSEYLE